ncbi:MAG: hypothetical protein MJ233_04590 [Mycoplasmoidaceae bacterium]|nr:hypothetical protein [Mycoplasmoidaceae bacterium]
MHINEAITFVHSVENPKNRSYEKHITHENGKKIAQDNEIPLVSLVFKDFINCGQLIDSKKTAAQILVIKTMRLYLSCSDGVICFGIPKKYSMVIVAAYTNNVEKIIISNG